MRSPLWLATFFAATFVVGLLLGWQIDRRFGGTAATAPTSPYATRIFA